MTEQQERKRSIRDFMRANYSDERLAMLLAHASDGKLDFHSCCCFIGAVSADHALQPKQTKLDVNGHISLARQLPGADEAEGAYASLSGESCLIDHTAEANMKRRRILIPMIRAEMKRRSLVAQSTEGRAPVCTEPAKVAV